MTFQEKRLHLALALFAAITALVAGTAAGVFVAATRAMHETPARGVWQVPPDGGTSVYAGGADVVRD